MFNIRSLTFFLPIIFPFSVLAFSGQGYFGGSIAASFATLSDSNPEITYDAGLLTDSYPLDDTTATAPVFSLNGGYEFEGHGNWPAIALGLGIYTTVPDYDFEGDVIEKAKGDPSFELYDYSYDVSATRLMLESQFTWELNHLSPFIQVGIGAVWINMKDYKEEPSLVPPFYSETPINFTYQVGAGLAKTFGHERIALGYRFVGLGETSFGTRGLIYPYKLKTGTLNTNDIYFSYTHLF